MHALLCQEFLLSTYYKSSPPLNPGAARVRTWQTALPSWTSEKETDNMGINTRHVRKKEVTVVCHMLAHVDTECWGFDFGHSSQE